MNERYIFRGKRKDNGKWVEGYYVCLNENCHRIYTGYAEKDCGDYYPDYYEVIPKTVSQYTGLKDKNGKLIFEGDIIRTKKYGRVIAHSNVRDYDIFIITYVPAVFRLENIHRAFNLVGNSVDYEVIGNIHDNPELLEVENG